MMKKAILAAACVIALSVSQVAQSQDLVGQTEITVQPGSDVTLALPFVGDPVATLEVQSVTDPNVTPSGGTTGTDLSGTFYVRFTTGDAAGLWSTIVTDNGSVLRLEDTRLFTAGNNGIQAGDQFNVYGHQTVAGIFPPALEGRIVQNNDEIVLFPENDATSTTNPAPQSPNVTFITGLGWIGGPTGAGGATIIPPGTLFVFRHASGGDPLTLRLVGDVLQDPIAWQLPGEGDLLIGSNLPTSITLGETDLGVNNAEAIFPRNTGSAGTNPSPLAPNATFITGLGWIGGPNNLGAGEVIEPGQGLSIRVPSGSGGTIVGVPNMFAD